MKIWDSGNSGTLADIYINRTIFGKGAFYTKECTPSRDGATDCSCNSGDIVISGGGWGGRSEYLRESRPLNLNTWRIACVSRVGDNRQCNKMKIICLSQS